jgi:hypothetical protein
MFEAAGSVLSIFSAVGKVHGRKKVQKMVHLLKLAGARMPFKYEYHHYGPYSAELQMELSSLDREGYLHESIVDETYVYEMTDKGREFKEQLDRLGFTVSIDKELIETMARQSSQFLEMVSTYAYLVDAGYKPDEARDKALKLKDHLKDFLDDAISFYNEEIVSRSRSFE